MAGAATIPFYLAMLRQALLSLEATAKARTLGLTVCFGRARARARLELDNGVNNSSIPGDIKWNQFGLPVITANGYIS